MQWNTSIILKTYNLTVIIPSKYLFLTSSCFHQTILSSPSSSCHHSSNLPTMPWAPPLSTVGPYSFQFLSLIAQVQPPFGCSSSALPVTTSELKPTSFPNLQWPSPSLPIVSSIDSILQSIGRFQLLLLPRLHYRRQVRHVDSQQEMEEHWRQAEWRFGAWVIGFPYFGPINV